LEAHAVAWLELHQSLTRHPKILAIARIMGWSRQQAIGTMADLWLWALDYAPDGRLDVHGAAVVAAAVDCDRENDFWNALMQTRLIDDDFRIHDWMEYAGKLKSARNADAKRKRNTRASTGHPPDVHRTSDRRPPAVHPPSTVQTGPDKTGPDKTEHTHTPSTNDRPASPARVCEFHPDEDLTEPPPNPETVQKARKRPATPREPSNGLFTLFFAAYPLKLARRAAEKAFTRIGADATMTQTMIRAIEAQRTWRDRMAAAGQFVPGWKHPATWLNQECWSDSTEIVTVPTPAQPAFLTAEQRARRDALAALGIEDDRAPGYRPPAIEELDPNSVENFEALR
jgi:hypothetical protein